MHRTHYNGIYTQPINTLELCHNRYSFKLQSGVWYRHNYDLKPHSSTSKSDASLVACFESYKNDHWPAQIILYSCTLLNDGPNTVLFRTVAQHCIHRFHRPSPVSHTLDTLLAKYTSKRTKMMNNYRQSDCKLCDCNTHTDKRHILSICISCCAVFCSRSLQFIMCQYQ